jgi:hypothetical protein
MRGGAREMLAGGEGQEIFAPDVSFSFPIGGAKGRGRGIFKLLLRSLPIQASIGLLDPQIIDVRVNSPSPDALIINYVVRVSTFADVGENEDEDEALAAVAAQDDEELPLTASLHVRTRLSFNAAGLITEWVDHWDRPARQFLEDIADFNFPELSNLASSSANDGRSDEDDVDDGEINPARRQLLDEDAIGESMEDYDDEAFAAHARAVALALPVSGPPLAPDAMADRIAQVVRFMSLDHPCASLPEFWRPAAALSKPAVPYPEILHPDLVVETPSILAQGIESLEYLDRIGRIAAIVRYSNARVACSCVRQQSERVFSARYVLEARTRLGLDVQVGKICRVWMSPAGEIIHIIVTADEDLRDNTYALFARMRRRLWVW